jgi:hypothetical protein
LLRVTLDPATSERLPTIRRASEAAGLPASDSRDSRLGLVGEDAALCVCVEPFGRAGLPRSLAVAESRRGAGEGSR